MRISNFFCFLRTGFEPQGKCMKKQPEFLRDYHKNYKKINKIIDKIIKVFYTVTELPAESRKKE